MQTLFASACAARGSTVPPDRHQVGLAELRLVGSRCRQCDVRMFPANAPCLFCLSQDVEALPLSDVGSLYSFTFIHVAPSILEVPYGIGYVDLPEQVRLLGKLADVDAAARYVGRQAGGKRRDSVDAPGGWRHGWIRSWRQHAFMRSAYKSQMMPDHGSQCGETNDESKKTCQQNRWRRRPIQGARACIR